MKTSKKTKLLFTPSSMLYAGLMCIFCHFFLVTLLFADTGLQEFNEHRNTDTIVFIDGNVSDINTLISALGPNTSYEVLSKNTNGLNEIKEFLSNYSKLSSIQIISHAGDGFLQLGNTILNTSNIEQAETWGNALSEHGDILLYGCDLAKTDTGKEFINKLAKITKADIAASKDITGAADKNGDWDLEINRGLITAKSVVSAQAIEEYDYTLASFNLTRTIERKEVSVGGIVSYTIIVENISGGTLSASIVDDIPEGFSYLEDSAYWDHDNNADTSMTAIIPTNIDNGNKLSFYLDSIDAGDSVVLRYQLIVGTGVNYDTYTNAAIAYDNDDIAQSSIASVDVKVVTDTFFDLSTIIGKVFDDHNGNGYQDPGDLPVPDVRLVTSAGQQITVDSNGLYHLANVKPGRMVIRIDEHSLPEGTTIVGRRSMIVNVRTGIPLKANFAVQLPDKTDPANNNIMTIKQVPGKPEPRLNLSSFGTAVLNPAGTKFLQPLEIRFHSNYPTFIKGWKLEIKDKFTRSVVKEFKGKHDTFFTPIYWNGLTKVNTILDPEQNYLMQLTIEDQYGRKAATNPQLISIYDWTFKRQQELGQQNQKVVKRDHIYWLRQLTQEDDTEKCHFRITGKAVHIIGEKFNNIRISIDGAIMVEMPHYNAGRRMAAELLEKDALEQPTPATEIILPRKNVQIDAIRDLEQQSSSLLFSDSNHIRHIVTNWLTKLMDFIFPSAYAKTIQEVQPDPEKHEIMISISRDYVKKDSGYRSRSRLTFNFNELVQYNFFTLSEPDRFVVDFKNSSLKGELPRPDVNDPLVYRLRSARRNKNDLRVVLDLKTKVKPKTSVVKSDYQYDEYSLVINLFNQDLATDALVKYEERFINVEQSKIKPVIIVTEGDVTDAQPEDATVGSQQVSIDEDDSQPAGILATRQINVGMIESGKENDLFLVGLVDGEIGYRTIEGNLDLATYGEDSHEKDDIWKDGKIQLYLKGTIKGKYLITASLDSERETDGLFSNLDPDAAYKIYGDDSNVTDIGGESDDMLYLLIERDESWAKWGKIQTALGQTQLTRFQRTLQGGQLHYESLGSTAYGEPITSIEAFGASALEKSAHNEYLATGSSLYYLKHQQTIQDSLQVKIEVRDRINGNVTSSRDLNQDIDYQFDSGSGLIILWKPVEQYVDSGLLISTDTDEGDLVYLVADYNYSIYEDWDKSIAGGRVRQALGNVLTIGGTLIQEDQLAAEYELKGVDASIHLTENHTIDLEYAESQSRAESRHISTDGGLSWGIDENDISLDDENNISLDDKDSIGSAFSLHGESDFFDERVVFNYYYREIEEDFSSNATGHQQGQKAAGIDFDYQISENLGMRLKHDSQRQIEDGSAQSNNQSGAEETDTTIFQTEYQQSKKLTLTGELRHQDAKEIDTTNQAEINNNSDQAALQMRYKYDKKTELTLKQQLTIEGEDKDKTSFSARRKMNKRLTLGGKVGYDTDGTSYGADANYELDKKLSVTTGAEQSSTGHTTSRLGGSYSPKQDQNYSISLQDERGADNDDRQSLGIGSSNKLNEKTTIDNNASLAIAGDTSRNSGSSKMTRDLEEGRSVYTGVTRYEEQNDQESSDGYEVDLGGSLNESWALSLTVGRGYVHRLDGGQDRRSNYGLGSAYIYMDDNDNEQVKLITRYQHRRDRGEDNRDHHLFNAKLKDKYDKNVTLFTEFNWSYTQNIDDDIIEARNNRFDFGFAYRPVMSDHINLISKYSLVDTNRPDYQTNTTGPEELEAHVIAADILYDFNRKWSFGSKFAMRYGKEKVDDDMPWAESNIWLVAANAGYHITSDFRFNLELRRLENQHRDHKDGAVAEFAFRFNNKIEAAVGCNWAGYSDDLGDIDYYDKQGVFLRVSGVFE